MITVHTRHYRTREEKETMFKTDLGAFEFIRSQIMDNTNVPKTIATDVANLLCDRQFRVAQKKMGPLFFTIHRHR